VPLVFLFEFLSANFPNFYSILLGLAFILIVYVVPNGIAAIIEGRWKGFGRRAEAVP
jgi:branched-chain amino acid transport system permease protein